MTKQYVWLVRYGKTEYPLVPFDGPYDSDIDPTEGIVHAESIAECISSSSLESKPLKVFCSPFLRTTHTASILANALSKNVHVEEGLQEYLEPSLLVDRKGERTYPRMISELKQKFNNIDESYESKIKITDDMFPENEDSLIKRCRNTLNIILDHVAEENIAIVTHAPCVQAIAFVMEGAQTVEKSTLGKWPLGGITRFSRSLGNSNWEMDFYGSTEHMPGEYKEGAGLWSLPCFDKE